MFLGLNYKFVESNLLFFTLKNVFLRKYFLRTRFKYIQPNTVERISQIILAWHLEILTKLR